MEVSQHPSNLHDPSRPKTRVVVIAGASNLALGLPIILRQLPAGFSGPLQVFAAGGHGRSYGTWSTVLGRRLPGITQSRLWEDLGLIPPGSSFRAVLTDFGNDLVFGQPVARLLDWADCCIGRLKVHGAEIILAGPPVRSVESAPRWKFELLRRIFFPAHAAPRAVILEQLEQLHQGLQALARIHGETFIDPLPNWYGLDPIHWSRPTRAAAWQAIFSRWSDWRESSTANKGPSALERLRILNLKPAERILWGRPQTASQPVLRRADMTLSLY